MKLEVKRFGPSTRDDFFLVHSDACGAGWCRCVAWYVPTWEGWGDRTRTENLRLREEMCANGEYDGYLLYADERPVGWCQVGPRDRLAKLSKQFDLSPDGSVWAVTCFLIAPEMRSQGLARELLAGVITDLRARGVRYVEAFPKRGKGFEVEDLWTGPESLFTTAGFEIVRDDPVRPILRLDTSEA